MKDINQITQSSALDIKNESADLAAKQSDISKKNQTTNEIIDAFKFIKQKIEKLSTAVYMVTSYIPHDEPVRGSLRVLALSSVGHSAHLVHRQVSTHFIDLQKDIEHIISLVRLARTLDIITQMNADILSAEYQKILSLVKIQKDNKSAPVALFENILDSKYYDQDTASSLQIKKEILPLQNIASLHSSAAQPFYAKQNQADPNQIKAHLNTESFQTAIKPSQQVAITKIIYKKIKPLVESKERRNVRQSQVLSVLSTEIEMTIKDVAKLVRGCSEKTIQRELNQLLENKKVKRLGEKRWSKYIRIV